MSDKGSPPADTPSARDTETPSARLVNDGRFASMATPSARSAETPSAPPGTAPARRRIHLPVLAGDSADAEDDPLALLRGGPFARWFAAIVGVLALTWVAIHEVRASPSASQASATVVTKVHSRLRAAAPPMPEVEEIPPRPDPPADPGLSPRGSLVIELDADAETQPQPGLPEATVAELDEGGFFDPAAFADAEPVRRRAYVHLMPGLPNAVVYIGVALIVLLSFLFYERRRREPSTRATGGGGSRRSRDYWRIELTRWPWLARAVASRWFQPAFQLPVVILFVAVIVVGLIGSQEPGRNIAPVLTWNIWWIGLIFVVLFAGNLWCFVCPWTAIPDWIMRGSLTAVRRVRSFGLRYPRFRLWMWPAIVLFAVVTWLELAYDAANRPWLTSLLALAMVGLAWLCLLLFERKAMCRYVCFVGRVSGQYATMGMLEIRRRDNELCRSCTTSDCFHGREQVGYPCPTSEYMGVMNDNQYCTLCTECIKSCPHDNIAINLRSSGADLLHPHRAKVDEAYLALLIFIVSAFHGAAMIPSWRQLETRLRSFLIEADWLGSAQLWSASFGGVLTFTVMMLACLLGPGLAYVLICQCARWASGRRDPSRRRLFIRFAATLLPIALFYHLAHNATHVFWEWSKLRRLISDPLGWGHDFFGTARAPLSALWSPETIWYIQLALVVIGHIYGVRVAQREAARLYPDDRRAALRVHAVLTVAMIAMSLLSLWLLAQPMYMRTADL